MKWFNDDALVARVRRLLDDGESYRTAQVYLDTQGYPVPEASLRRQMSDLRRRVEGADPSPDDATARAYIDSDDGRYRTWADGSVTDFVARSHMEPVAPLPAGARIDVGPGPAEAQEQDFDTDKKESTFYWRDAVRPLQELQRQIHAASTSQDHATIRFLEHVTDPIFVVGLSDLHMTSWAADLDTLVRVTDELLTTPNLYAILLGDELEMAIKMRSVAEAGGNSLPPKMQFEFLRSWLKEIAHKVLCSCWSNHQHDREEKQVGVSISGQILGERTIHHSGIGHADVLLGEQTYKFALSHVFRGRSYLNGLAGQQRYMRMEAPDREICWAGDSHNPGFTQYVESGTLRTAINGGSAQVNSSYARRYFSLRTWQAWPGVELDPRAHRVTPFWSVKDWLTVRGQAPA